MAARKNRKTASLTEFAKGMVLSEANVTVVGAKFTMWDYAGKRAESSPALCVSLKDTGGDVHDQYYSAGNADDFAPSSDGKALEIITDREKVHEQTNFAKFMEHLFSAGFPKTAVDNDDIGCLVGTRGHVSQVVIKRTGGNVQAEGNLLVFDKIDALPGEGEGGDGSASDELRTEAESIVVEILSEAGGALKRNQLLGKVLKHPTFVATEKSARTELLNLIKGEDFIMGEDTPWEVKNGELAI